MSNQPVKPPNKVSSAYESLIESFRTAVEDAGLSLNLLPIPVRNCFRQTGDAAAAEFRQCLYLQNWPCRRIGKDRRLDVVIKALETFGKPAWSLTKSTVYLNYFLVTGSQAELVQALHYDFVQNGQADHPYFHVQLSNEMIPETDLRAVSFRLELKQPTQPNHCWVTTRIPTPDMTLSSVLYCLMADHCGHGVFSEFAKKIQGVQERLPSPNFDALKASLQESMSHFKSSHWFAHMSGTVA